MWTLIWMRGLSRWGVTLGGTFGIWLGGWLVLFVFVQVEAYST